MSGGFFEHKQWHIQHIADEIKDLIENNSSKEVDSWGELIYQEFSEETLEEFKKAVEVLKIAYVYTKRIDWLLSGDDGEDSFHRRLKSEIEGV